MRQLLPMRICLPTSHPSFTAFAQDCMGREELNAKQIVAELEKGGEDAISREAQNHQD